MQIGQEILLEIPLTGPITVEITKTDGFLPGKLFWLEVDGAIPKAQGYVDEVWRGTCSGSGSEPFSLFFSWKDS